MRIRLNLAEQRALERPITREGVLRGHSLVARQDTVLYSVLRGELPAD
jgi:hypothetical protein